MRTFLPLAVFLLVLPTTATVYAQSEPLEPRDEIVVIQPYTGFGVDEQSLNGDCDPDIPRGDLGSVCFSGTEFAEMEFILQDVVSPLVSGRIVYYGDTGSRLGSEVFCGSVATKAPGGTTFIEVVVQDPALGTVHCIPQGPTAPTTGHLHATFYL